MRTLYRRDDLTGSAARSAQVESLALPGESYKLAFTPGLLGQVFERPRPRQPDESLLPPAARAGGLGNQGGYVDLDGDGHWWDSVGPVVLRTPDDIAAAAELAEARRALLPAPPLPRSVRHGVHRHVRRPATR